MQFDADRALFAADSIDLHRALILPNGYSKNATELYTKQENDFVRSQAEKNRTRLAAACTTNPLKPWAIKEIRRCHSSGLRVLKVHFVASGMDLKKPADYQVVRTFLSEASRLGYTVIVYANYPAQQHGHEIEKLKELIESFPDIRWIIGHLFGREHELLRNLKHPNFFVEVSIAPVWMKSSEQKKNLLETIRTVGIQHFIFGSDWPVVHPAETLKSLKLLGLSENELNAILYSNSVALNDLFTNPQP